MIPVQDPKTRLMIGYAASIGSAVAYGTVAVIGRKIVGDYAPPLVATAFSMAMGTAMVALLFVGDVRSVLVSRVRRGSGGSSRSFGWREPAGVDCVDTFFSATARKGDKANRVRSVIGRRWSGPRNPGQPVNSWMRDNACQ